MEKNILLFGESNSGKSSIVNMLFDDNVSKTSDGALGTTFKHQKYCGKKDGYIFNIYDTTGLSETDAGTVSAAKAVKDLVLLLQSIKGGVNVLILCVRKGTILKSSHNNYNVFVHGICQNKVPVILAVTWCELDNPMSKWWEENKDNIIGTLKMTQIKACVCMTTIREGSYADIFRDKYLQSRNELAKRIVEVSLSVPWKMEDISQWIRAIIKACWNIISEFVGVDKSIPINKRLFNLFVILGFQEKEAVKEANDLWHEMQHQ